MLAHLRRAGGSDPLAIDAEGRGEGAQARFGLGVIDGFQKPDLGEIGVVQRLADVEHGCERRLAAEPRHPVRRGVGHHHSIDGFGQGVEVFAPRRDGRKTRIGGEVLRAGDLAPDVPEFRRLAHQKAPAVLRPDKLARRDRRVRPARQAARDMALIEIPRRRIGQLVHRGVEQADVDVAALAGAVRRQDAGQKRGRKVAAGVEVDHRQAEADRRAVRLSGQAHEAGFGLHQIVIARPGGAGVAPAIGGQVPADDLRIDALQRRIGQFQLVRLVAAQIVRNRVGGLHQRFERRAPVRRLQVEGDGLLALRERLEELRIALAQQVGPDRAGDVAAARRVLDLDHLGAEIGQKLRAIGPGAVLLDRQDAQALQKRRHRRFPSAAGQKLGRARRAPKRVAATGVSPV